MKKTKYLTTGEFAKLCRTTKETLFHYDREGLLKPRHVSGNGYRRYGLEQFFDFDMIVMLKETGSSLKEVKHYKYNADVNEFLSLLEEKTRAVKQERARLAERQKMLEVMASLTREALTAVHDRLEFVEQAEERLEVLPTKQSDCNTTAEFVERFLEYIDYYEEQGRHPAAPFGEIALQSDIQAERYKASFFFSRATPSTPRAHLLIKPKGLYAVFSHKGEAESHSRLYLEMVRKVLESGLSIAGNAYHYDMMSYVTAGTSEEYFVRYCIHVK